MYNGVLTVQGTEGNDDLTIVRVGLVRRGRAVGPGVVGRPFGHHRGGGDDLIRDWSGLSAIIYGGVGNDTIYAGRGHDTIYGGEGDDTIYGNWGADVIWGGSGTDTIAGGRGQNTINYGSPDLTRGNTAMETEIIRLVNAYRRANGVHALAVSGQLNAAADLHSLDMVAIGNQYGPLAGLQHLLYGSPRPRLDDRLDAVGYDNWTRLLRYGENIALGFTSAADVVAAWISSPSHRQNILNPRYTQTGVSIRTDAWGNHFFTQEFGVLI